MTLKGLPDVLVALAGRRNHVSARHPQFLEVWPHWSQGARRCRVIGIDDSDSSDDRPACLLIRQQAAPRSEKPRQFLAGGVFSNPGDNLLSRLRALPSALDA